METPWKQSEPKIPGELFHLMPPFGLYTMRTLARGATPMGRASRVCQSLVTALGSRRCTERHVVKRDASSKKAGPARRCSPALLLLTGF